MAAHDKFEIIQSTLAQDDNMLSATMLCEIASVSRSGYYRWLRTAGTREKREQQDRLDFELVLRAYRHRGYSKGARGIYVCMLHWDPPVVMNLKKIRRLMGKYGLACPIRKVNPYRRMARALKSSHVADNLLNREFTHPLKNFGREPRPPSTAFGVPPPLSGEVPRRGGGILRKVVFRGSREIANELS